MSDNTNKLSKRDNNALSHQSDDNKPTTLPERLENDNQEVSEEVIVIEARKILDPVIGADRKIQGQIMNKAGVLYVEEIKKLHDDNALKFEAFVSNVRAKAQESLLARTKKVSDTSSLALTSNSEDDVFAQLDKLAEDTFSEKEDK